MKKLISFLVTILICILLTGTLFAQETGEITAKVFDEEGTPLPGVSILATSPSLQGKRSSVSSNDGSFRLPLLPIGNYTLTFKLQGFATVIQENVGVKLGMITSINVTMKIAAIEEQVTVTAEVPLIDKTKADTSFRAGTKELTNAPIQGRTIHEIMHYTPGVTGVRNDTNQGVGGGGVSYGPGSFRGEGESGNNWLVDGLSKRTSREHRAGVRVNYDSWEEVQFISDGYSPELGQALGGIINIVTKSGGNKFHGELGTLILNDNLRAERKSPQLAAMVEPDTSINNYYGNIGGPIVEDKLWFFISNNYWYNAEDMEGGSIAWLAIPDGKRRTKTNNFFGKLTFSPFQNHTLSFSGTYDKFLNQTGGIGLPDRYTKIDYEDYAYRLNYKAILGPNTLIEAAVGRSSRYNSTRPLDDDFQTPACNYMDIGKWTGNQISVTNTDDKRTDFTSKFTQYINTQKLGNHEIGVGFSYYYMSRYQTKDFTGKAWDLWPGNGLDDGLNFSYLEPGVPFQAREWRNQENSSSSQGFGIYLKDKITFGRFSLLLGMRSETQKIYNDVKVLLLSWDFGHYLSPRISLAWDVTGDGVNVFKVGYGQFSDLLLFDMLNWFNQTGINVNRMYLWIGPMNPTEAQLRDTANWEFLWQQGSLGELGEPPSKFKEGITPDKLTKFTVEFDRRLGPNWALKLRGIYHNHPNMIEDMGMFDYTAYWYSIQNWEKKRRRYVGIEVEMNGRIGDNFFLNSSYVWSQAKGTTPGTWEHMGNWTGKYMNNTIGAFGDHESGPDDSQYSYRKELSKGWGGLDYGDEGWYGFLPYSCDHVVRILGIYSAPYGFTVTTGFEYYSGYHWSKIGLQEGYGVYFTFPEGRGTEVAPAHTYVDLSIQKDFILYTGIALGLRLNINNLLNSQVPVSYMNGVGSALYGEVYGRQFPRWVQIQAVLKF